MSILQVPEHEVFEPKIAALRTYEDSDYQPVYFVADSIFDAMQKLKLVTFKHQLLIV